VKYVTASETVNGMAHTTTIRKKAIFWYVKSAITRCPANTTKKPGCGHSSLTRRAMAGTAHFTSAGSVETRATQKICHDKPTGDFEMNDDEQVMETARIELEKFTKRLVEDYWGNPEYHRDHHNRTTSGKVSYDIAETLAARANK